MRKKLSDTNVRSFQFHYIPKADASPSIVEAPSVQSLKLLFLGKVLFEEKKKLFTISKILKCFVVSKRDSQNKNF